MEKIMRTLDIGRAAQVRELQNNELDTVTGGVAPLIAALVIEGIGFLIGISAAAGDKMAIYNTTGRGDNNGCTGHQC
jgi:lactobin A/cerein 7B family class IIb bacteriocin